MIITFPSLLKDFSPWLRAFPTIFPSFWNSGFLFLFVLNGCWGATDGFRTDNQGNSVISVILSMILAMDVELIGCEGRQRGEKHCKERTPHMV